MDELRRQVQIKTPFNEVMMCGDVRTPCRYPLETGVRISELIRAGGSMSEGSSAHYAEFERFAVVGEETGVDRELTADDMLSISLVADWNVERSVDIGGEVKFPGAFQILQGETQSQLSERAGGLTDHAFPQGAIFLRESLREREREQMDILAARTEADPTSMSLETLDTTGTEALQTGKTLLTQLRHAEPVGRLVIDLEQIASRDGGDTSPVGDIALRDGDRSSMPVGPREVTVISGAQQPKSHLHQPGLDRDDYIELSGGLTRHADKKLIHVLRASGAVISSNQSKWFGRGGSIEIRPGDTVVVPLEPGRIRPLTFWANVTQMLNQGAIAVAAVKMFNL